MYPQIQIFKNSTDIIYKIVNMDVFHNDKMEFGFKMALLLTLE